MGLEPQKWGFNKLRSKLPGNHGPDHVWIKGLNESTGIADEIWIVESKLSTKGNIRMNQSSNITQGSEGWIRKQIRSLKDSSDPSLKRTGELLERNFDKIKMKAHLTCGDGSTKWFNVDSTGRVIRE